MADRAMRGGMVGMGMIFDETYRPFFETVHQRKLHDPSFGVIEVPLAAVATRTGTRAKKYQEAAGGKVAKFENFHGEDSLGKLLREPVDFVCVATPDDRHFEAAKAVLSAGKHLLIEKPSVLEMSQLDELVKLAVEKNVLAKVVYHKLLDPDHKKLRTLVHDQVLQHVNNGYCSLLEPKSISVSGSMLRSRLLSVRLCQKRAWTRVSRAEGASPVSQLTKERGSPGTRSASLNSVAL